ncbi:lipid droplet-associated hydrolase isoform 2-T3 [Liasis olivaceus]
MSAHAHTRSESTPSCNPLSEFPNLSTSLLAFPAERGRDPSNDSGLGALLRLSRTEEPRARGGLLLLFLLPPGQQGRNRNCCASPCLKMLGAGREPLSGQATSMKSDSKEQDLIREEFTYIYGALTQILKCGPWEDLWNDKSAPRLLFLVIPEMVSNETDDVFGLHGQVEHKLNFLRKNVPKDVKLVLIGHSIGCYIALKIMKHAPELEILRTILLFPTIERMAHSPQGRLLTPLLCQLRYILYMPAYLLSLLPEKAKSFLVRCALHGQKSSNDVLVTTSVDMINMDCIANIMYLGSQEMRKVIDRDNSTIKQHLKKLIFYYGATDVWCPLQYYEEMKMEFPDGDIRLCEKGIHHAFVLDASREMAEMITGWVQDDLARL